MKNHFQQIMRAALLSLFLFGCMLFSLSIHAESEVSSPHSMSVLVLGSGGPGATGRAGSGYLLFLDGKPRILVDAGPGTFVRVAEAKASLSEVDIVLLTHLHVDHTGELPGLVKSRAVSSGGNSLRFDIYGPDGVSAKGSSARFPSTSKFVEGLFGRLGIYSYLKDFSATLQFHAHNVKAMTRPKTLVDANGLLITAMSGHHGDAPSVIYRVNYFGKSVTFSGDIDAAGHMALKTIAKNTEMLIFNAVVRDPPNSRAFLYTLHSSPTDIGKVAGIVAAKQLVLSHLNPSIDLNQQEVQDAIKKNYQGKIEFAQDGVVYLP